MSILAQVFSLASQSIKLQRGIANNDQKSRIAFTIIDSDLKKMSYNAIPFLTQDGIVPMQLSDVFAGKEFNYQQGYVYISENDDLNDSDDVLQFTTNLKSHHQRWNQLSNYYGLAPASFSANDIDFDDGNPGNSSTDSTMAEITYFLRHGTLYRQVQLLREPLIPRTDTIVTEDAAQPPITYLRDSVSYYKNFGLSAHYNSDYQAAGQFTSNSAVYFNTSLSNNTDINSALGKPEYRTGFYRDGSPLEFAINTSNEDIFIGRFTREEQSHNDFQYPASSATKAQLLENHSKTDFEQYGYLSRFKDGPLIGSDILLTNVVSFDVQVWDNDLEVFDTSGTSIGFGAFANVGHANSTGQFRQSNCVNTGYGPTVATNRIYDTWHPSLLGTAPAPYGTSGTSATNRLIDPAIPGSYWTPNTPYTSADVGKVFVVPNPTLIPAHPINNDVAFILSGITTGAGPITTGTTQPSWPTSLQNSEILDNNVKWKPILNAKTLRAIKINIRFRDLYSDKIRQLSLMQSFVQ
jgi:hypothetical protein